MRIFNITKGVKGMFTMYNRSVRHKYMITEKAKEKAKILLAFGRNMAQKSQKKLTM